MEVIKNKTKILRLRERHNQTVMKNKQISSNLALENIMQRQALDQGEDGEEEMVLGYDGEYDLDYGDNDSSCMLDSSLDNSKSKREAIEAF